MRSSLAAVLAVGLAFPFCQAAPLGTPALGAGQNILVENGEITGGFGTVTVIRYTWRDKAGDPRSVALVPGSPTNSGYAARFTYQVVDGAKRTVNVDADAGGDGGFGYFVSHELYRGFICDPVSGNATIACLHGEDDSPLGRYLPSTGSVSNAGLQQAAHEFRLTYPRWGTAATTVDPSTFASTNPADHQKFNLPVVIRWHFVAGENHPLWSVEYDLTSAADKVANDVRAPYGVMYFNEGVGNAVTALHWSDKYEFSTDAGASDIGTVAEPAANQPWSWNTLNTGRRYNVLSSGAYEFGLVDTVPFSQSRYGDGYADRRGKTSAQITGCGYGLMSLPCGWQWAYQSFQDDYGPPARPKLAWGASPFLGSSINPVYISDTETETLVGATGRIHYGLHIVLGRSGTGGKLTRDRAAEAMEADRTLTIDHGSGVYGNVTFTVLGDPTTYFAGRTLKPWDSVRLQANTINGGVFLGWGGACNGVVGPVCIVTMYQGLAVTASFQAGGGLDPNGDADGDGIPNGVETAEGRNPNLKDNDIYNSARLFTMQQYRDFLGREGDSGGITYWTGTINGGSFTRAAVIEQFFSSNEFQGTVAPVARLYFAYFLRVPDYSGLNFWIDYYRQGHSLDEISGYFAGSAEFISRYGSLDNAGFVNLVYQNVLGRAPDPQGFDFWKGELDSGRRTRGNVMLGFSESPEYRQTSESEVYVTMMYFGMLRRSPDAGGYDYWVQYRDQGNSGQALINGFLGSPEYRGRFLP